MHSRALILFLLVIAWSGRTGTYPASAWIRGFAGNTGSAILNLGGNDFIPANVINVLKTTTMTFDTSSDASRLDDDGYFTSGPTGNVLVAFPVANTLFTNTQYRLRVEGDIQFSGLRFLGVAMTSCATSGTISVTGCTGIGNTDVSATGSTTRTMTFSTTATQFTIQYLGGSTAARTTGTIALYRVSDETDYLAGEIFTAEYRAVIAALNPRAVRPMGWVQAGPANLSSETDWLNRNKLSTFNWTQSRIPPRVYGGAISGTDTYSGSATPSTPAVYTDGEQFVGVIANANTSTSVTLDVGGRGAKTVLVNYVTPSVGGIAIGIGTFTYDALIDRWNYNSGGIVASVPIEAQVQLANRLNSNLWAVVPPGALDDYVTRWAEVVRDSLNAALYFYPEYSNEIWNFGFPQTQLARKRGQALGWTTTDNQDIQSWYGLRVRQIMANITTVFGSSSERLRRVMSYQAASDTTIIGNRFNGALLNASTYPLYGAYTGGVNYDTFPNRPIDVSDVLAYAPYAGGANLCTGPDIACTPASTNLPFYQALVDAWEAGNATSAIQMIDDDIRTGRTLIQDVTASGTTFTTQNNHGFTANSTSVAFQVTGGTTYSGVAVSTIYLVSTTPTTKTFTIKPYSGGFPSGANVNAGAAGSGTTTVGSSSSNQVNMTYLASTWYQFGEANATLYDTVRSGARMAALRVEQYEGNLEPSGLSSAQCGTVGVTGVSNAQCAADITAAILAWKNDSKARDTQRAYFDQFMGYNTSMPTTYGLMAHSKSPAQLVLPQNGSSCVSNKYALLSGCLPTSAPFQTYYGFQAFRAN